MIKEEIEIKLHKLIWEVAELNEDFIKFKKDNQEEKKPDCGGGLI